MNRSSGTHVVAESRADSSEVPGHPGVSGTTDRVCRLLRVSHLGWQQEERVSDTTPLAENIAKLIQKQQEFAIAITIANIINYPCPQIRIHNLELNSKMIMFRFAIFSARRVLPSPCLCCFSNVCPNRGRVRYSLSLSQRS